MRNHLFTIFLALLLLCGWNETMAQNLRPKGKLMLVEYTDTLSSGFLVDRYRARQLNDGRVEVTAFGYYSKYDSLTVYGDRQPLDSIQRIIEKWIEWFHPKGKRANDKNNKGRFTAVYDSGETLLIERLTWCWGTGEILKLMRDYCDVQVTRMPLEQLKGTIPQEARWHNGSALQVYCPQKGLQTSRYRNAKYEFLVFRDGKSQQVHDVWVRTQSKYKLDEIIQSRLDILAGVYQNAKGMAVFGNVNAPDTTYNSDPGADITFRCMRSSDGVVFTDTIDWGENRIQEVNPPPGAPPGWGGAGAFTGPSTWTIRFTPQGLHVEEISTGINAPTHPDFGKVFDLRKIRGPYRFSADPWAITCAQPLTKGQLSMLSLNQLREMLSEMEKRHADGSKLSELEQINKSLIQTVMRRRGGK